MGVARVELAEGGTKSFLVDSGFAQMQGSELTLVTDYSKRDMDKYFFSGATQLLSTVYSGAAAQQPRARRPPHGGTPRRSSHALEPRESKCVSLDQHVCFVEVQVKV